MLDITTIKSSYQGSLQYHDRDMIREYLQYKILDYIFSTKESQKLCFIGGTALRIAYHSQRFSEDLDFDNFGLTKKEFESLTSMIQKRLELEGFEVEMKNIYKGAYHCHIKIPKILYENKLAAMPTQKIVIKIDTAPHGYVFTPSQVTIANFDVVKNIKVAPKSLLLAHKLVTIFQRKRAKGRDFWDIMFLLQTTRTPDRGYISAQMGINTPQNLKQKLSELCQKLDFKFLQKDVAPFLFDPYDQKVELFPEYIQTIDFS